MPMTGDALKAFQAQCDETPGSEYLFPTPKPKTSKPYITTLKEGLEATLAKAGVPDRPLYERRHTLRRGSAPVE